MRLNGEADRLLGSQKSRRFCQIAKSPTSFDPASITSGCRQPLMSAPASVPRVARPSEATAFARSAYITDIIFFMLCAIATVVSSALVKILPPQQGVLPSAGGGFPFGRYAGSPSGEARQALRLGADVIALHEIHLARQSSLQVPVGHIPVPGGIKLCSPGTFWVANYLIINNGPCQVNFTKPNSATIRYTNSQWLREDATEVPVGGVAVPKSGQKTPSPRGDASGVPVDWGAVPKSGRCIGQRPV